jgi:hypothetical protein
MDVIKNREPSDEGIPRRLPADLVEAAVVTELRRVMRAPSITAQVIAHLTREGHAFAEADVTIVASGLSWADGLSGLVRLTRPLAATMKADLAAADVDRWNKGSDPFLGAQLKVR